MRKILGYSITAAFLGLAPLATMAVTPTYDALTVFGDSYCDVGNLFLATGGAEAPPPYYNGCFSNGPIWLDNVAGFLGVPLRPSVLKRTDYAFGGAWVTEPASGTGVPSILEQVKMYSSQHNGKADPDGLFILEGGGNDILDTTTGTPKDLELLLRQAHDTSVRAYLSGFEVEFKRFEVNHGWRLHLRAAKVRRQTVDDYRTFPFVFRHLQHQ